MKYAVVSKYAGYHLHEVETPQVMLGKFPSATTIKTYRFMPSLNFLPKKEAEALKAAFEKSSAFHPVCIILSEDECKDYVPEIDRQ
jgi:hypothetical protein